MKKPYHEGLYIFKGIRRTKAKGFVAMVNDICEVRSAKREGLTFMACVFLGRSTPFPIELFDGEWQPLEVKIEGERVS